MKITVREAPPAGHDVIIETDGISAQRYLRKDIGNAIMIFRKTDSKDALLLHREWHDRDMSKAETAAFFRYVDEITREHLGTTFDAALAAYRKNEASKASKKE
ncbi:hypothetical protein WS50_12780 [Burkholderia territorii]|uniref:hypothetical protein n=1 Tax=Burkholderia territorii TaxID=1503055 RepID=UPI000753574F|nr:hypothetical protein [Burkholderia territorii]KUZ03033.1 hypothetical protein WS47_30595 [Burkholderia territorii]KUZ17650.1 hypothetical protein WS50_12780 [Burkholderia territorii]